jgi:TonB family protein
MKFCVVIFAFGVFLLVFPQSGSFEKEAIASVQQMPAYELDRELPKSPFGAWFKQLVGQEAGVVWQLAECGDRSGPAESVKQDLQACAEANAFLADGNKVIVAISVGTFKKGLVGQPAFYRAVVDYNLKLNQVRRLHELPDAIKSPETYFKLPQILLADAPPLKLVLSTINSSKSLPELPTPPGIEPKESEKPLSPQQLKIDELQKIKEGVLLGNALKRVQPVYPVSARFMNAMGNVEVQVRVSAKGAVTEAKAISGHPALRSASVDAAKQWLFKPTTLNGAAIEVQSVLTFVFAPREK